MTSVNIVSFNIRYKSDKNGHSIPERAPRIEAVTSAFGADVIGFQEFTPAWEDEILSRYGEKYGTFYKYRDEVSDIEASPVLWRLDRFELVGTEHFWLSDTPDVKSRGWDTECTCYRMCVIVRLRERGTGAELAFANTHFGFGTDCHEKSARLILERTEKYKHTPLILVGDFNMTPDEDAYPLLTSHFTDANAATVCDRGTTYHGYAPERVRDEHIDYIFVSEGITPAAFGIVRDTFDGGKFPSDHYALTAKASF